MSHDNHHQVELEDVFARLDQTDEQENKKTAHFDLSENTYHHDDDDNEIHIEEYPHEVSLDNQMGIPSELTRRYIITPSNNNNLIRVDDEIELEDKNRHEVAESYSSDLKTKTGLKLSMMKSVGSASHLRELYVEELKKNPVTKNKHYIYTYLTLLGLLGGLISFSHDIIVRYLVLGRNSFMDLFDPERYFYLRMFIWVAYNLCLIIFAVLLTAIVGPSAEGSGLAGIKAILNGVRGLKDVLSMKTMIVKYLCLPAVLTSGLYIGKMGPNMHIGKFFKDNDFNFTSNLSCKEFAKNQNVRIHQKDKNTKARNDCVRYCCGLRC